MDHSISNLTQYEFAFCSGGSKSFFFFPNAGDNILTAIHVARQCGMIGQSEVVVEVNVTPPTRDNETKVTYTLNQAVNACSRQPSPSHEFSGKVCHIYYYNL